MSSSSIRRATWTTLVLVVTSCVASARERPVIQFDVETRTRKVIAFLHPFYQQKYGVTPVGTFGSAIDEKGEKLYVVWNANRGGKVWDCVALSVVHIPPSERP